MQFIFNPESIRKARKSQNLSAKLVAKHLGKRRCQYLEWENGTRIPNSRHLGMIAGVLGVSPDIFFEIKIDEKL